MKTGQIEIETPKSDPTKIQVYDPKTKNGRVLIGINIIHHPDYQRFRWFVNGENCNIGKVVEMLEYDSQGQFTRAMKKYGTEKVLEFGIEILKSNARKNNSGAICV
jgi:hypothetical protein